MLSESTGLAAATKRLGKSQWHEQGVGGTAALMMLMVMAHYANQETGEARLTYDDLHQATALSRTTMAGAFGILNARLIESLGRST